MARLLVGRIRERRDERNGIILRLICSFYTGYCISQPPARQEEPGK
jgi:hypothetical protein